MFYELIVIFDWLTQTHKFVCSQRTRSKYFLRLMRKWESGRIVSALCVCACAHSGDGKWCVFHTERMFGLTSLGKSHFACFHPQQSPCAQYHFFFCRQHTWLLAIQPKTFLVLSFVRSDKNKSLPTSTYFYYCENGDLSCMKCVFATLYTKWNPHDHNVEGFETKFIHSIVDLRRWHSNILRNLIACDFEDFSEGEYAKYHFW